LTEVILGTANFGNPYGILNRQSGVATVTTQEAMNIIKYCKSVGIRKFDTASTYGPATGILESYIVNDSDIDVLNKISWVDGSLDSFGAYEREIAKLMESPIGEVTSIIQWHNWDGNILDLERTNEIQSKIRLSHGVGFGVTTYGVANAEMAVTAQCFDSIQFEYNVLNQRIIQMLSKRVNHTDCKYIVRSILLQGLLPNFDYLAPHLPLKLLEAVNHFQSISNSWQLTPLEVAIRSMLNYPIKADLVVGATSIKEIEEILECVTKGPLPVELFDQIIQLRSYDATLADPRNWKKT
jgi:aryl-alcohol dehydrogenase-like predicted oxidoreductase